MSLIDAIVSSGTGMNAQSLRLNTVASNLANVETTSATPQKAYHAKMPVFQTIMLNEKSATEGVRVLKVEDDKTPVQKIYDPGNPQANKDGYVYGNNVNRIEQLTDMISASQSYQADAQVANTCKALLMNTISMIKE
jgi:flagellar basal-body rod protein FlgC